MFLIVHPLCVCMRIWRPFWYHILSGAGLTDKRFRMPRRKRLWFFTLILAAFGSVLYLVNSAYKDNDIAVSNLLFIYHFYIQQLQLHK